MTLICTVVSPLGILQISGFPYDATGWRSRFSPKDIRTGESQRGGFSRRRVRISGSGSRDLVS